MKTIASATYFDYWGNVPDDRITNWVAYLRLYGDNHDRTNLNWSGQALLNSIGSTLWDAVERQIQDPDPPGPVVFNTIINLLQATNVGTVRKMIEELGNYSLEKEPGEMSVLSPKK